MKNTGNWIEKLAAARKMISALCSPRVSAGHREWVMRIPAEPDYDPDLVIGAALDALQAEVVRLDGLINSPSIDSFMESVRLEAGHQRERWVAWSDAGKSDADWFWLIGYLAGKAIRPEQTQDKRLHHIITVAAVCLNWHRHATGEATEMRPGIAEPSV